MKKLLMLFASLLLVGCDQPATLVGTEILPDGTVVKHYKRMIGGSTHHIYVAEGRISTTTNRVGKHSQTDAFIEN